MSGATHLTRRRFIGGCAALAGLGIGLSGCRDSAETLAAARRLSATVGDPEHWSVVGRADLDGVERAPRLESLVAELDASLGGGESEAVTMPLAERVRLDFEEELTFRVDGWLLAVTEVRLAAVVALTDGQAFSLAR